MTAAAENFVDFQNVWLAYNDELLAQNHFAVEDINLQVKQGEFIAIVGPSGCGKSTFMKLTTGLRRPTKGSIHVGVQMVDGPLKISGMAFQAPSLLPWRTTLDNVLLPLEIVEEETASEDIFPLYEFEPEVDKVLDTLLPVYIENRIYNKMLQSAAAEHAARQKAMKSATDNADKLILNYTRLANQARQAEITQQISEIVGGADALSTVSED